MELQRPPSPASKTHFHYSFAVCQNHSVTAQFQRLHILSAEVSPPQDKRQDQTVMRTLRVCPCIYPDDDTGLSNLPGKWRL